MGFGNVNGCSSAYTWEAAHRLYENTPEPRNTRSGNPGWRVGQKPLDDKRKWHYRIEQHVDRTTGDPYYDMVLYHTVMARYYKPTRTREVRLYTSDPRNLSKQFMWSVVGRGGLMREMTTDGVEVAVPLYDRRAVEDDGDRFSARLVFDQHNRLIVAESAHAPHGRSISTDEDRAERKACKEQFANLVMLAIMRLPEYERCVKIDRYAGRPYKSVSAPWGAREAVKGVRQGRELSAKGAEIFFEMCQSVYDTLASKRAYVAPWGGGSLPVARDTPITSADFERSLWRKLMDLGDVSKRTGTEPLPQFMPYDEYLRSNVHALY